MIGRAIDTISFALTTHCNMQCPNCCAGMQVMDKAAKRFYDWDYMERAAEVFRGIRRVNLTGGEASIHPQFEDWTPKLKDLFQCEVLAIWTNGTTLRKKAETFKYFDEIHITNYTAQTFPGSPDNSENIAFIRQALKGTKAKIYDTGPVRHFTPETKQGDNPCFRLYSETVEYVDGYLYPCCAGSGLATKIRLKPTATWREDIVKLHPPCHECLFGEK